MTIIDLLSEAGRLSSSARESLFELLQDVQELERSNDVIRVPCCTNKCVTLPVRILIFSKRLMKDFCVPEEFANVRNHTLLIELLHCEDIAYDDYEARDEYYTITSSEGEKVPIPFGMKPKDSIDQVPFTMSEIHDAIDIHYDGHEGSYDDSACSYRVQHFLGIDNLAEYADWNYVHTNDVEDVMSENPSSLVIDVYGLSKKDNVVYRRGAFLYERDGDKIIVKDKYLYRYALRKGIDAVTM